MITNAIIIAVLSSCRFVHKMDDDIARLARTMDALRGFVQMMEAFQAHLEMQTAVIEVQQQGMYVPMELQILARFNGTLPRGNLRARHDARRVEHTRQMTDAIDEVMIRRAIDLSLREAENRTLAVTDKDFAALRRIRIGPRVEDQEPLECSICKDEMCARTVAIVLPCDHIFCEGCIEPWLKRQRTCPMCRAEVIDVQPSASRRIAAHDNARRTVSSNVCDTDRQRRLEQPGGIRRPQNDRPRRLRPQ